ncbi:MAG: DUF4412 domain-containing protein [Chlorobi bacterium]|nr:DUF4412 domain-containing protein [Chlorobiota bacterium]
MINRKAMITFFLVLIFSANLFAGGIVKLKSVQKPQGTTYEDIIYVQNGKLRMESNGDEDKTITIIDPEKGTMIDIDKADNSYIVLTQEDFRKFSQKMKMQKEEMLKQLPEEQREAMSKMIDQQMGQMKNQPKTEFKKVGNEKVNGYDCEVYQGFKSGTKVKEIWITPWENIKLKDEYIKVFKGLKKFFQQMTDNMGEYGKMIENEFDSEMFDKGFPVKTIEYEDGNQVLVETIEEVTEKELSPVLFEVPKNMTKKDSFGM